MTPSVRVDSTVQTRFNCYCVSIETVMDNSDLAEDFQKQFNDVVSRLQSKDLFQSDWDIVSFSVLFIFIGEQMTPTLTQKGPL